MTFRPTHRRRTRSPYDSAALGVYRGPNRAAPEPKATPYRVTLLRAIAAGEVKAGQGQYVNAWRWHHAGTSITVSKWVNEFLACRWARVVGAHPELTEAGAQALAEATRESETTT